MLTEQEIKFLIFVSSVQIVGFMCIMKTSIPSLIKQNCQLASHRHTFFNAVISLLLTEQEIKLVIFVSSVHIIGFMCIMKTSIPSLLKQNCQLASRRYTFFNAVIIKKIMYEYLNVFFLFVKTSMRILQ
ncbi:hypothetical protein C0J52_25065 [Blattella germanica]|nr:hypothetical protein C0J52_25065 [Blattella germanica]